MICSILCLLLLCAVLYLLLRKKERFSESPEREYIKKLQAVVSLINPEFSKLVIQPGNESVTVDKKKIYICLKDPVTKEFYPFDVLIYVMLHEIAHVESVSYSTETHNLEFERNFQKLLSAAYDMGILQPDVAVPTNYCSKEKQESLFDWLHFK